MFLNRGVFLDTKGGVTLADYVGLAEGAQILTHEHSESDHVVRKYEKVVLKDFVMVNSGTVILPDVTIGEQAIVHDQSSVMTSSSTSLSYGVFSAECRAKMDYFEAVKTRHSVRVFQKKPVEEEKISRIIEAINLAPSAGDLQAYEVVVVKDPMLKDKLAKAAFGQSFVSEAPVCFVFVACPERSSRKYGRRGIRALLYPRCVNSDDICDACGYSARIVVYMGRSIRRGSRGKGGRCNRRASVLSLCCRLAMRLSLPRALRGDLSATSRS